MEIPEQVSRNNLLLKYIQRTGVVDAWRMVVDVLTVHHTLGSMAGRDYFRPFKLGMNHVGSCHA